VRVSGSHERFKLLRAVYDTKAAVRMGIAAGFIHIDVDDTKAPLVVWLY